MAGRPIVPLQKPRGVEIYENNKLFPGFVFEPMDEEIILCYLSKKANKRPLPTNEVIEYDLYGDHEMLRKMFEEAGKQCLYFFTKLEKKATKGSRIKRCTKWGTWKAQNDKPICFGEEDEYQIGSKRSFKFMPKKGFNAKGRWIMHEYRLDGLLKDDQNEYVLCRVKWEREKEHTFNFLRSTDSSEITMATSPNSFPNEITMGAGCNTFSDEMAAGLDTFPDEITMAASPDTFPDQCIVPETMMREGVLPETCLDGFEDDWSLQCPNLLEDNWISELIVCPPDSEECISSTTWEVPPCF